MQIILIIQEISFWSDSFLWNTFSDLEQKIPVEIQPGTISYYKYILLILRFCSSTKVWKEAWERKIKPMSWDHVYITIVKKNHAKVEVWLYPYK